MGRVMGTRTLYRPVGLLELELILDSEARAFPPRLPEQPIFYPVLNVEYATEIASTWNPFDARSGFSGFVTEFEVDSEYLERFETKVVGARRHQELWVPSECLPEFNAHVRSKIKVTAAFYGPEYQGPTPLPTILRSARADEQLQVLHRALCFSGFDFVLELAANWKLVLSNHGLWSTLSPEQQGLSPEEASKTLASIRKAWELRYPELPLPRGLVVNRPKPVEGLNDR